MELPGYSIVRMIDKGGMATVYLAVQDSLHRQIALKVMEPTLAVDQSFTQRFLKEGRTIAQFQHSNIVTIYDCGSHGSKYYLTMEFLPGGTLDQQIKEGLTLERSLVIIKQIAKALAYAHQHGVIHRDLKPKNILFRKDGTPVLTDFGIAKVLDGNTQLTALGTVMGSPHYMSPEQVAGRPLDARSDLYSLGIVFYEMLVKRPPYQADDVISLAMMHCTAPIPVLPKSFSQFQPTLQRLLAKNPDERFDNAEQLIQALESLPAQPAAPSDQTVRIATPPRRGVGKPTNRMKTGLVAGAVLLLAIAGGGTYLLVSRQSAPPSLTPLTPATTGENRAAARRLAEEEAKRRAAEEAKQRADEEAKQRADEEAKWRAEEEAKRRAADEAKQQAATEEAKRRATEEEAKRRADEAVKQRATEEEAKRGAAAEEAKRRAAAEEAKRRAAEDEARLKATAEELKRQAMDEAKRKATEEANRQAAEEAKRRAVQEAKRRAVEEAKRRTAEPAPKPPPAATTTSRPSQTTREVRDQQRPPSRSISQNNRRCVDILNRESLGDILSSADIAFKMKECR